MRRDANLIRKVILFTEGLSPKVLEVPVIEGYTHDQVGEHVRLAREAGLLDATDICNMQDQFGWAPRRLTNLGHDFADAVREESSWKRVLDAVGPRAETIASGVLTALITAAIGR
jgi:hypothetical protein